MKALLSSSVVAIALCALAACASKPAVTETTVTQTNPDTGTTVTRSTGVASDKDQTTTWTKQTIKHE